MKRIFFCLCLLVSFGALQAQQPKHPSKPAQPKTEQDEIQKMLKEAQQELDNMSPEERAEMEKMGIKMPKDLTKIVPGGASDANLDKMEKDALAQNQQWRKAAIAALPKKPLSDAELLTYLQGYLETVERKISPKAKANALKIYNDCKAKGLSNRDIENTATVLWVKRACEEAVWILAKMAPQAPQNGNLLNNLAATTTLLGGGHLALPILQKINRSYPNNSAILNNMGQAWCDLGVADSTKKYLALALAINPSNCNANYTMGCLLKAEGNTQAAISYLKKSIKNGFSAEKAEKARKWGAPVTREDLSGFPREEDPLRMERTILPDYAFEVGASVMARVAWLQFQSAAKAKAAQYKAQADKLIPIIQAKNQALQAEAIRTKNPRLLVPLFAEKAAIYYGKKLEFTEQDLQKIYAQQDQEDPFEALKNMRDERAKRFHDAIGKKYPNCPGEGCNHKAWCNEYRNGVHDYTNAYLSGVNALHKRLNQDAVDAAIKAANASANLSLYLSNFPEEVEYANLMAKNSFLNTLASLKHTEIDPTKEDCGIGKGAGGPSVTGPFKLLDYDDVMCTTTTQIAIGIAKFKFDCTKMAVEAGEGFLVSFEGNYNTGEVDIGFGIGVEEHLGGSKIIPLTLEGGVKEMIILHFDGKDMLADYGYKFSGGVEGKLGPATLEGEISLTHTVQAGVAWDAEVTKGVKLFGGK